MKHQTGYFLIEALISIVIFTMLIVSLFSMISFLQLRTVRSAYDADASLLAQEGIEVTRNALLSSWDGYPDGEYHPVFDGDSQTWILSPGKRGQFGGQIRKEDNSEKVCRGASGEMLERASSCAGGFDKVTRMVSSIVSWQDKGIANRVEAELLVLNHLAE